MRGDCLKVLFEVKGIQKAAIGSWSAAVAASNGGSDTRVDVAREVRAHRLWMGSAVAARAVVWVVRQKAEEGIIFLLTGTERLDKKRQGGGGRRMAKLFSSSSLESLVDVSTVWGEFGRGIAVVNACLQVGRFSSPLRCVSSVVVTPSADASTSASHDLLCGVGRY